MLDVWLAVKEGYLCSPRNVRNGINCVILLSTLLCLFRNTMTALKRVILHELYTLVVPFLSTIHLTFLLFIITSSAQKYKQTKKVSAGLVHRETPPPSAFWPSVRCTRVIDGLFSGLTPISIDLFHWHIATTLFGIPEKKNNIAEKYANWKRRVLRVPSHT